MGREFRVDSAGFGPLERSAGARYARPAGFREGGVRTDLDYGWRLLRDTRSSLARSAPRAKAHDDEKERRLEDVDAGDDEGNDQRQRVAEQPARGRGEGRDG
jgi:hypothetical protein